MEGETVTQEIMRHIEECDTMYVQVHGAREHEPHCNVCRKLMAMGFPLDADNLPEICIQHCQRWAIIGEEEPQEPADDNPSIGGWLGFAADARGRSAQVSPFH